MDNNTTENQSEDSNSNFLECTVSKAGVLKFKGSSQFRTRIICSILSGRRIKIEDIRSTDTKPGLTDYEANFLRLIDKMTNGTEIVINETGTKIFFKPGFLVGGNITHECPLSRSVGYFLQGVMPLAPFGKQPLSLSLEGITNEDQDASVDLLRTVTLPLLKRFGIEDVTIKTVRRGAPPKGGGLVKFDCQVVRQLTPLMLVDEGKVRRIRGIAYATRLSPQTANRMSESAKGILLPYQQDTFIYTDHFKGKEAGESPGFALTLVAETTTSCAIGVELVAGPGTVPEELGEKASYLLLTELLNRGCVDTTNQSTALMFMALCTDQISKIRLGKLSPYTVKFLRHLKDFFGVTFRLEADTETGTTVCTCRGAMFKNLAKRVY